MSHNLYDQSKVLTYIIQVGILNKSFVIVQVVSILNLNNKILKSLNVIKRRKKLSINWLTRISFFQRKNKKFFNLFSSNTI